MTVLRFGSSGEEVKTLQTALNWAGASLNVDGKYGLKTQTAVRSYQQKNGLQVDGICGPETWSSLEKAYFTVLGKAVNDVYKDLEKLPSFKNLLEMI